MCDLMDCKDCRHLCKNEINDYEVEKNLTEEKLQSICKQYMNELGIDDTPDYLNLEYWG